jgi:transposase
MTREVEAMKHQLDWFRRQLFGQKSEKRLFDAHPQQMSLGELPVPESSPPPPPRRLPPTRAGRAAPIAPQRASRRCSSTNTGARSDHRCAQSGIDGLTPDQYEVIGQKISHRLAQRPGSYVILKYVRPVIKRCDTQVISCPAAPVGVIEGSRADVSFVAGVVTDKFCYHQPLYRQHQRMGDNGIRVSRPWLTQLTHAALSLLEPVYTAQLESIRQSRVKAMDETPIKAGRSGTGKMKGATSGPSMASMTRSASPITRVVAASTSRRPWAPTRPRGAVLLTDGYGAYERYAQKCGLTHAQCWAHYLECRFMRSRRSAPQAGVA